MQLPSFLSLKKKFLPILVVVSVLSYLAFLLSSTQPDVFFSGDGGMKYLIINQIKEGKGFMYMNLDQPGWVKDIWVNGYFPFHDPFMYPSPKGLLFSFPPYFQLISAVFYSRFGYWGLYILPAVSAMFFWFFLFLLLRRCGITRSKALLAVLIVVFCSPLTIYGATYWEHMPAVLLLLGGLAFLVAPPARVIVGSLLGLGCGLAVFLRPEALVLNALYGVAGLVLFWKGRRALSVAFILGIGLPTVLFFISNELLFGSVLGVHSYQVLRDQGMVHEILRGGKNFFLINILSIRCFPFILLLVPVLYGLWRRRPGAGRELGPELSLFVLGGIVVLFCGLSPFLVPNEGGRQWGARYFLPMVPIVIVFILLAEKGRGGDGSRRWPGWVMPVALMVTAYTFIVNTVLGGEYELRKGNYERVKPALEYVRQQPERVIVSGSEYIPMEMAAEFNSRYFFWARDDSSFRKLIPLLKSRGIRECLYVGETDRLPLSGQGGLTKKGNYYISRFNLP